MIRDVRRESALLACGLALFGWLLIAGCGDKADPQAWQRADGPPPTPEILVEAVRARYAESPEYADSGMLILNYSLQGTPQEERHPLSTVFDRARVADLQRFALRAHWETGKQQIAVFDPKTGNLGGQVVVRDEVEFGQQTRWPKDEILEHFATGSAEIPLAAGTAPSWLSSLPLALAAASPEQPWLVGKRELLDASFLDGHECWRLRVATPAGRCVVWIDRRELLVRRVELPPTLLDEPLLRRSGVSDPRLVLDLADASWSSEPQAERLAWTPAEGSRLVRHFVSLPEPFPSETIGGRPAETTLARVDGTAYATGEWADRQVALFWFSSDPVCRAPLEEFLATAAREASATGTLAMAICTDPPSDLPRDGLTDLLRRWNVPVDRVLRDPQQVGKSIFDVSLLPTVIVLGKDGRVQYFDVLDQGRLGEDLAAVLRRVAAGEEIAAEMRDEYRDYLKLFETQLVEAAYDRAAASTMRNASFAPQRLPELFSLSPREMVEGLTAPGNPGVVGLSTGSDLVVLDGYQTLVRIGADGKVGARIDLGRETADNYTQVRGCRVGDRTWWAVGSVLGTRLKLIVDDQVVATIDRPADSPIRDWALGDAAADGRVDLWVGHWQNGGLVRFDQQGREQARTDVIPAIASLAWATPGRSQMPGLWATSRDGGLFRVSDDLSQVDAVNIDKWQIAHVFASEGTVEQGSLLTLALDDRGGVHAVAFDTAWRERWSVRLSHEVFRDQVQFVRHGEIDGVGLWAIARPDGSIHLIDESGDRKDRFQLGATLTGMAFARSDNRTSLWVSTAEGLRRWDTGRTAVQARNPAQGDDRGTSR